MKAQEGAPTQENRRGFVRHCFGAGASLAALPIGSRQAMGSVESPNGLIAPKMSEYERILSHTKHMQVLGNPRSWSLVSQALHPFAPERVVLLPSGSDSRFFDRCGRDLRRKIDEQIDVDYNDIKGVDPKTWFPDTKRESIYWMMDAICGHYGVTHFEQWVVGLARREILGQTAFSGMGLAHQYQHGGGEVPVDNPPVDWWMFLYPNGYDWGALDEQPIFAIMCHVVQHDPSKRFWSDLYPIWGLTQQIWTTVPDWSEVGRMRGIDACRYLNWITAQCLANNDL
jgi:hypothetical protein